MPGIFRNGAGAAAINQDGTVNSVSNPAKVGSIVSIWATGASGFGSNDTIGQVATEPINLYEPNGAMQLVQSFDAGSGVPQTSPFLAVTYAGPAPGLTLAAFQVNFEAPATVTSTMPTPISILASGAVSPAVMIYLTP